MNSNGGGGYFSLSKAKLKELRQKAAARRSLLNRLAESDQAGVEVCSLQERNRQKLMRNLRVMRARHKLKLEDTTTTSFLTTGLASSEYDPNAHPSCALPDEASDLDEFLRKEDKDDLNGPKNDYCQNFVDSGQRPQNFIRDAGLSDKFDEYPKLKELHKLKDELVAQTNVPRRPLHLVSSLRSEDDDAFPLGKVLGGCEFDVILVEPPLFEYQGTNGVHFNRYFSWDELKNIDVGAVAAQRSFLFLWCGSADGLDKGRECLKKWGFRRCEDICWVKMNRKSNHNFPNKNLEPEGVFHRTKEHCLMGIKGTVRRSQDSNFIHTNIDIDLIITEEPDYGVPDKPQEIFRIIERFCLGRRRLYLFGRDSTVRPGWVTVGPDLTLASNFDAAVYKSYFSGDPSSILIGSNERIETLRPKTPPPKLPKSSSGPSQVPPQLTMVQSVPNLASLGMQ